MRYINSAIITGPTGAIGNALCRKLIDKGVHVYAFVRPASKRFRHLEEMPEVEIVECDASELAHPPIATKDIYADAFFHLAWGKTTGQGRNDMAAQIQNIQYTLDAVQAAKVFGCSVFIGAGSQAEYGRVDAALAPETPCFPENGYGMAKLCAGQMSRIECEALGIEHIWPRILSVYGPHDGEGSMITSVIRKLLEGERPALTAGEQIWDYLYADDAAEALYRLAVDGAHGKVYPVGSGKGRPLREYIEVLRNAIDPSLQLGFGEVPYGEKQVMRLEADIRSLQEDTGFAPQIDFETGIQRTIDYIRKQPLS